jgi:ATP-binding cassette subfamily B protein
MENIAFGVEKENIDLNRVIKVAKNAQIHSFIKNHKDGYNALVGERGVRLSGGQRQRIGIARALYKGAKVLLLDEATSALDESTETEVMKSIAKLDSNLTVIIIAHRISTLSNCDSIIQIENGKIIKQDSYDYFINNKSIFLNEK